MKKSYNTLGSESHNIDQIIIHPDYIGNSLDNDYALLHLTSSSSFEPITYKYGSSSLMIL